MRTSPFLPLFLLAALIAAGCSRSTAVHDAAHSTPGTSVTGRVRPQATSADFDFYLLNLSWSPEFCQSHPNAQECAQHKGFVLHGLWPERADGSYPENCSSAPGPSDPSQYADIYPDPGLLQHEWKTHGTCSGLSADAFFTTARRAYQSIKIPSRISQIDSQTSMTPDAIKTAFQQSNPGLSASNIAISCGNNYLTAVEVCLDKSLSPVSCGTVKTCHANTVKIPAP